MAELVGVERHGSTAVVRLQHPPVNAINRSVLEELAAALDTVGEDESIRVVVLVGDGRGFCGGGDTTQMGDIAPVRRHDTLLLSGRIIEHMVRMPKPLIGAVHGFLAGAGLSLAFACDITIVEVTTRIRPAFGDLAIIPDLGAHHFLVEAMGVRRATELIFAGTDFTAADALSWGLVNAVVPEGEAFAGAMARAEELAARPRWAITYSKSILADMRVERLRRVMIEEGWASTVLRSTGDHQEGLAAIREKRPPLFTD
jgi:2-(1,2-epoxy-1,2-dihydrophenyl)acetyl-CoA isomerase